MAERWTKQMDNLLIVLREQGYSFSAIAAEFTAVGIPLGKNACLGRWRRLQEGGVITSSGCRTTYKKWTPEEEEKLVSLLMDGMTIPDAAATLERSITSVRSKWEELRTRNPALAARKKEAVAKRSRTPTAKKKAPKPPAIIHVEYDNTDRGPWVMTPAERRETYRAAPATLMYLSDEHHLPPDTGECHFILGKGDQWRYCRQPCTGSYCAEHEEVCYGGQTK